MLRDLLTKQTIRGNQYCEGVAGFDLLCQVGVPDGFISGFADWWVGEAPLIQCEKRNAKNVLFQMRHDNHKSDLPCDGTLKITSRVCTPGQLYQSQGTCHRLLGRFSKIK